MHRACAALVIAIVVLLSWLQSASAKGAPKAQQADNCESSASPPTSSAQRFSGNVSWYGIPFHGRKTASGRNYDMNKLTCAHRTLPFGTKILVSNPRNGKSVIVEVIDRGPYVGTRVMDLSREAARQLDILLGGTAFVNCLVLPNDSDQEP